VAAARVAAHVLGLPEVGFVPHPGPGVVSHFCAASLKQESQPWVDIPRRDILSRYGFDVLKNGLPLEFYSPRLNLVTTIPDFYAHPTEDAQKQRFGHMPFTCVGAVADVKVKRVDNVNVHAGASKSPEAALPLADIDRALESGRKLVYVSLGTVVSSPMLWTTPLGKYADSNDDGKPEGARGLCDYNGKEFSQFVWRTCFEALGGRDDLLVVMSLGPPDDALDGMPPVPSNFIIRKAVPQLEVLRRCSAFLTHGGANSMHEALAMGVPLAVVPVFGDQPVNADSVRDRGAGASFRHPLRTLSAEALRSIVDDMTQADSKCRDGAKVLQQKLAAAGGVAAACHAILDLAGQQRANRGGA